MSFPRQHDGDAPQLRTVLRETTVKSTEPSLVPLAQLSRRRTMGDCRPRCVISFVALAFLAAASCTPKAPQDVATSTNQPSETANTGDGSNKGAPSTPTAARKDASESPSISSGRESPTKLPETVADRDLERRIHELAAQPSTQSSLSATEKARLYYILNADTAVVFLRSSAS